LRLAREYKVGDELVNLWEEEYSGDIALDSFYKCSGSIATDAALIFIFIFIFVFAVGGSSVIAPDGTRRIALEKSLHGETTLIPSLTKAASKD